MYLKLFLICLLFCTADAKIEDHFKSAEGKSRLNTMRNIDFIYLINLDQRPEKLEYSLQQLYPYGIHPYRFSAVNGWELSLEAINDVGVKFSPEMEGGFWGTSYLDETFAPYHEIIHCCGQTYFCHCLARERLVFASATSPFFRTPMIQAMKRFG